MLLWMFILYRQEKGQKTGGLPILYLEFLDSVQPLSSEKYLIFWTTLLNCLLESGCHVKPIISLSYFYIHSADKGFCSSYVKHLTCP